MFVYNFLGIAPEQRLAADAPPEGRHVVGVEFAKERISENLEALGTMRLYIGDEVVDSGDVRTQTGHYALCGEGLCIGHDGGDAVSGEYRPKFPFTGGRLVRVVFDVADDQYVNVERKMAAVMARD